MLFFDDESKRTEFVKHLQSAVTDISQKIRVKEMSEKLLLKEALSKEQRAQIVETFIRHAFSKVTLSLWMFTHPVLCCSGFTLGQRMASNRVRGQTKSALKPKELI